MGISPAKAMEQVSKDFCKGILKVKRSTMNEGGGPRVAPLPFTPEFGVRFPVSAVEETKYVSSPSTCESQYCGEPP